MDVLDFFLVEDLFRFSITRIASIAVNVFGIGNKQNGSLSTFAFFNAL